MQLHLSANKYIPHTLKVLALVHKQCYNIFYEKEIVGG